MGRRALFGPRRGLRRQVHYSRRETGPLEFQIVKRPQARRIRPLCQQERNGRVCLRLLRRKINKEGLPPLILLCLDLQGEFHRGAGMDRRSIKKGNIALVLRHQQRDLRAAQDDALGASGGQVADDPPIGIPGSRVDDPPRQFINDDPVDPAPVFLGRRQRGNAVFSQ